MTAEESVADIKRCLRKKALASMKAIDPADRQTKSRAACQRILQRECFQHAHTVMLYMPMPSEIDVTPLAIRCFQTGVTVCVPRVDWERREMTPVEVASFNDAMMDVDDHGIRTPRRGRMILPSTIDLVIVPGLAFDTAGNRLGRGGGFYDRFLNRVSKSTGRIGICFDEQVIEHVPSEPLDMKVDLLITDRRSTRTGGTQRK